jgi:UDP-GlcNAc:undecaprenyl-phosphate/decaprenyl-phosphate GlcNAc-1-phosphate transferase
VLAPLTDFVVALIAAALIVRLLASRALGQLAFDRPNERSLHGTAVPRSGGVGLVAGGGIAWAFAAQAGHHTEAALAAGLAAVFLVDDLRGLTVPVRLAAQAVAVTIFAVRGGDNAIPSLLLVCLIVPGLIWSMNAYNFMDGVDGLAGGMAMFGFGAYAIAAQMEGARDLAGAAAIVSGAALGFLMWNFPPARIFLGDAGSIALGFLAAVLGILGWRRGVWPAWFPLLVFSPFLLDATVTLLRRLLRGETVWHAHRSHYYQRLVRMGWSHRRLTLLAYGLMVLASISALTALHAVPFTVAMLLSAWGVAYAAIAVWVDQRWSAFGTSGR